MISPGLFHCILDASESRCFASPFRQTVPMKLANMTTGCGSIELECLLIYSNDCSIQKGFQIRFRPPDINETPWKIQGTFLRDLRDLPLGEIHPLSCEEVRVTFKAPEMSDLEGMGESTRGLKQVELIVLMASRRLPHAFSDKSSQELITSDEVTYNCKQKCKWFNTNIYRNRVQLTYFVACYQLL